MEELEKLRQILNQNKIPYINKTVVTKNDGIDIPYNNYEISVVSHKYSYGGKKGLLEMMASFLENSVQGWLNAEQVFEIIAKETKKRKITYRGCNLIWGKLGPNEIIVDGKICFQFIDGLKILEPKIFNKKVERGEKMEELKQQLIGQKEGMEFALDLLKMQEKSLEDRIQFLDKEIEKIKE